MTLEEAINLEHVKRGYKVTCDNHSPYAPTSGYVAYRQGHWTVPKVGCGPLAVFATYTEALDACNRWDGTQIWACCFIESKEKSLYYNNAAHRIQYHSDLIPKGTRFADAVMIL